MGSLGLPSLISGSKVKRQQIKKYQNVKHVICRMQNVKNVKREMPHVKSIKTMPQMLNVKCKIGKVQNVKQITCQ